MQASVCRGIDIRESWCKIFQFFYDFLNSKLFYDCAVLIFSFITSQNDQTHLKNVATLAPRFLNRFATLLGIYLFWYESVSSKSAEQKVKKLVCCCGYCVRLFKNSNHQLLLKRIVCNILQNLVFMMCSSHLVDQELLMSENF